jgi:hypothetical protein
MRQFEWYRGSIPHIRTRRLEKSRRVLVLRSKSGIAHAAASYKEDPRSERFRVFASDERLFLITLCSLLLQEKKERCCCKVKR